MKKYNSPISVLKKYFDAIIKDRSFIIAAYVFGSYLKEEIEEQSDLDLAFLLKHDLYKSNPLQTITPAYSIAAQIGLKLNRETDVIILNSSSIEIAYEIITTGKCIYQINQDKRLEYEAAIRGMYMDFIPFISELRASSINKLSIEK